ncbi:UDP-glucuronosyltransferase 2B31-like isoform X7 [Mauremys mutica]|uniref:UDP-glucuronosyltransferase 2B31-like isoform X7 n=1 Tax=Mauremys mutica TaxID=74926 RepID=UPI001D15E9E4|nr:UDP-glucuronosyltransferase 2B31-like isoform X7 [Mauremys mutica]
MLEVLEHNLHRGLSSCVLAPGSKEVGKQASRVQQLPRKRSHMMSGKYIAALFLVLGSGLGSGSCGKVLVWPADNSHWLNVKSILEELADRGHEVTVLLSSSFLGIDPTRPSPFNFEVIPVPFTKEDMASLMEDFIHVWLYELPNFSYWETTSRMCNLVLWKEWNQYYSDVLGRPTTLCETMGKAEMWLIRTYWDFEFPRPFLPNFEFVGGLHCKPAKPLPEEMEEFVQSSGEHGIVVFSLGSMIYNLTEEKSNMVALALSQIPQKVLWRYKGKKPETLGPNTRIYDWIPQNDLLGHPKTKAFITHGGTNGIYEAIYHGIPMVGIPIFADQPDNIAHMKAKGMAVQLDFNTMQTQDLIDALDMVINNSSYKENAVRLSEIHHDQPIKPLDRAVFWIEFVMRHKGAKHLRPAAHELTWYQYHCLDVLAFLLICAAAAVFIAVRCCLFCCKKCGRIVKKKKTE